MKDLEKTNVERHQSNKRARRRKRNMSAYYIMVVFLVICVGITLSMTVFFNIDQISLTGEANYSAEQILYAGGIAEGDNLVRINTDKVEKKILKTLVYIDDVNIKKEFPSTLVVTVKGSIPKSNIQYNGGYLLVSEGGKVLEQIAEPRVNLLVVTGYNPQTTDISTQVSSDDEQKEKIMKAVVDAIDQQKISNVLSLDVSNKYNILINYDNRIQIQLGSYTDIDYKLRYANKILTESISNTKEGYLIMREGNEASFVTKEDMEKYKEGIQENESVGTTTAGQEVAATTTTIPAQTSALQTNIGGGEQQGENAVTTTTTNGGIYTTDEYGNIVQ